MGLRSQRLSKDEKQNYKDEQRLLIPGGQYVILHDEKYFYIEDRANTVSGRPKRDRGAIPIRPGSVTKKYESFIPKNTIGSGPGTRTTSAPSIPRSPFTIPKNLELDRHAVIPDSDDEEITPPRKRLKTVNPEIIDLEDDDQPQTARRSPSVDILHTFKRPPPRVTGQETKKKSQNISKYWPLDGKSQQQPSTMTAQGERRVGRTGDIWPSASGGEQSPEPATAEQIEPANGKHQTKRASLKYYEGIVGDQMVAVEVPVYKPKRKKLSERLRESESGSNDCTVLDDNRLRTYDLKESSDELQGDKTIPDSWRERGVSPGDLRHSKFTTPTKSRQKTVSRQEDKNPKRKSEPVSFDLCTFRHGDFHAKPVSRLIYNRDTSKFSITSAGDSSSSKQRTFDFMKAIGMYYSEHAECGKVRINFPKSQDAVDQVTDIEFTSEHEKKKFWNLMHKASPSLKRVLKGREWMDKLFQAPTPSVNTGAMGTLKREGPKSIGVKGEKDSSAVTRPKRIKLTDNLGDGDPSTNNRPAETLSHAHPSPRNSPKLALPIPIKTYRDSVGTRSKARKQNLDIDSHDEDEESTSISIFDTAGKHWQRPLVYPETGKKKAEVEAHDLDRLRPHEFLNDNLIGLYIRFLEHHLERQHPDLAKRIYFFNSYFFATLTNTAKGQKGINYQGVEKWTRTFDIFAFDYLVVPINEKAHWYVAIICNLPGLLLPETEEDVSGAEDGGKDEALAVPDVTEIKPLEVASNVTTGESEKETGNSDNSVSDSIKDDQVQESFTSMTLKDNVSESNVAEDGKKDEPLEHEEWPDEEKIQPSSSAQETPRLLFGEALEPLKPSTPAQSQQASKRPKPIKKRGQKNRGPVTRYDAKQPSIVVFDSLDCPRPPTIRILRDYLKEEAQAKRSLTINDTRIKGMNAKQIPHQPNFSDCGLYLLAYLEKFVQNPDAFVKSVLRREMDRNKDWPAMKPGLFRSRLRKFLLDLYEEQDAQKSGKRNQDVPLMVDAKTLNILLDNVPAVADRVTDDDTKEPNVFQDTPKPKDKRGPVEKRMTPTRSSPRHDRKEKDDSGSKLPKTPRVGSSHVDSVFAKLRDFASRDTKPEVSGGSDKGSVQVPGTPPPASPEIIDSSPASLGSVLASPNRRSKRNLS
ncbi:Ulp1 protease family protein [Arthroderma uncinatum]|uniref:Ulp1 protease family protein n=1 Tax=Arthroderma uncinatum TaxID=74035 RepID=UPI00144AAA63|nr:Ulp1 protease family protein [Arthroderma uncinatum]KAF3479523.1 Ulp1 protease family protein [Arthroderma uncinatum]